MSPSITNTMRRFSRGSGTRNSAQSAQQPHDNAPGSYTPPLTSSQNTTGGVGTGTGTGIPFHDRETNSRPTSAISDASFEHMNRPTSQQYPQQPMQSSQTGGMSMGHHGLPHSAIGGLSRTDQVVLRYFWEEKYLDNAKRDLHFLKFPLFPQYPGHTDLMPYCEIYHLVKTTPGASIISLGSANGVYIGFELAQGAQLHIDMDDSWEQISHHRVIFKPYEAMLRDPTSDSTFRSWSKPLTLEFLEEQYRLWMRDLTSFCWTDETVRDLSGSEGPGGTGGPLPASGVPGSTTHTGGPGGVGGMTGVGQKGSRGEL